MDNKYIEWNGGKEQKAVDLLSKEGHLIVSPTKVGYIIMATDAVGLRRKFSAKQRALNKPGVVLCTSLEQLRELANTNEKIDALYQRAWQNDVLLGCILAADHYVHSIQPEATENTRYEQGVMAAQRADNWS